jgi:hypothetical protein
VEDVGGIPQPPCDGCKNYELCKQEYLACSLFINYVHFEFRSNWAYKLLSATNLLRTPTKSGYLIAFEDK